MEINLRQLGGPDLPSVGFAAGADRLLLVMEDLGLFKNFTYNLTAYVMPLEKESFEYAFDIMLYLRSMGVDCEIDYNVRKIGSQFKIVDRKKATFALIIGTDVAAIAFLIVFKTMIISSLLEIIGVAAISTVLFVISIMVYKSKNFDVIDFYKYHDSLKKQSKK